MSQGTDLHIFDFGAIADMGAGGDAANVFLAGTNIQVVEVGVRITTDLVLVAGSETLVDFDITSNSVGVTASETTAPTRAASSFALSAPTTAVTVQDGKTIHEQCDFTVAKGELLTAQCPGNSTSGAGNPYMLYRCTGQGAVPTNTQRGGAAVE